MTTSSDETAKRPVKSELRPNAEESQCPEALAIDRLIMRAGELHIPVEYDQSGKVQTTWVKVGRATDPTTRAFVRRLLATGFTYSLGKKAYWR